MVYIVNVNTLDFYHINLIHIPKIIIIIHCKLCFNAIWYTSELEASLIICMQNMSNISRLKTIYP